MIKVSVKNHGTFRIKNGKSLLSLFVRKNIPIPAVCNGQGRCGLCRVRIGSNNRACDPVEKIFITTQQEEQGYHLACRYHPVKDTVVTLSGKTKKTTRLRQRGALALDLGTTIVKGALVDMHKKKLIKTTRTLNLQSTMGGDVITRVGMALQGEYASLQTKLKKSIEICKKQLGLRQPLFTTVTGNSVMLSFYLDQPIESFAAHPFRSPLDRAVFKTKPPRYIFPVIGGFIGGDIISGILASGVDKCKKNVLYADLGTNGEVVLITPEKIYAASTAAGPAFEGVGIQSGSLAARGAIKKVRYCRGKFTFETIDKGTPVGICASGLVDILYLAVEHGFISHSGRLNKQISIGQFNLDQHDIRKLQLSVGAIHAGMKILMKRIGFSPSSLDEIIITGEFGRALNQIALKRIGLIPSGDFRVRTIKDLALKGTIMALLDDSVRKRIDAIKQKCTHVELATRPDFQKEFVQAMSFSPWG
jgi:uncharacterized 2Fe-2S/4Fe-4S cluster protein (DUF4445 family)